MSIKGYNLISAIVIVTFVMMGVIVACVIINSDYQSGNPVCEPQEFTELKMSTIHLVKYPIPFVNIQDAITDSDGVQYIVMSSGSGNEFKRMDGHNVTFSYNCYNGRKVITGILSDNSENYNIYACKDNGKICWKFGFNPSLKWEISNITINKFNTTTYYPIDSDNNLPHIQSNNIPVYNPILDMYNNLTYNSSSFNYTYTHFDNINITPYDPEHDILIPV